MNKIYILRYVNKLFLDDLVSNVEGYFTSAEKAKERASANARKSIKWKVCKDGLIISANSNNTLYGFYTIEEEAFTA